MSLWGTAFFGIGAYSFAIATAVINLPPAVGLILGIVVPGLIAFVLGLVLLTTRIRIAYFAVVMLGLNEITKTIVANMKSIGSSYGLTLPSLPNRFVAYYVLLGLALAVTGFAYCIQRTRWGYGLKAILADEVAAEMTGVDTVAHKLCDVRGERRLHRHGRRNDCVELELRRSLHGVRSCDFVRHGGDGDVRWLRHGRRSCARRHGHEHRQGTPVDEFAALPPDHLRRARHRADHLVSWRNHSGS